MWPQSVMLSMMRAWTFRVSLACRITAIRRGADGVFCRAVADRLV
jgi:hypothetical protein